jgi:large subunit ribosomal protein L4e
MPAVFSAPIRDDVVSFCHTAMAKNRRQAHGVFWQQGHQHSAESWGTGRAVARIPRISGSGTHRSGQAAFGNMCRKGRMFAPLKIWRKWHRKSNLNQKRHAVASALAASACAPLVLAKGHRVMDVPELPLVADSLNMDTTAGLLSALNSLGAKADLERVRKSKKMRAGQGKYRNARFTHRRGPLIVYGDANPKVKLAARNLPGVDVCSVNRLNLLQLAPGGVVGRFVVFTRDAFESLDHLFGSYTAKGQGKKGYQMQRNVMECADLARIINADQVQSKLRGIRVHVPDHELHDKTKRNPLKNKTMMQKLNPNSKAQAVADAKAVVARVANRAKVLKEKRSKVGRKAKAVRTARFTGLADGLETAFVAAHQFILDEIKDGQIDASESEEEESDE